MFDDLIFKTIFDNINVTLPSYALQSTVDKHSKNRIKINTEIPKLKILSLKYGFKVEEKYLNKPQQNTPPINDESSSTKLPDENCTTLNETKEPQIDLSKMTISNKQITNQMNRKVSDNGCLNHFQTNQISNSESITEDKINPKINEKKSYTSGRSLSIDPHIDVVTDLRTQYRSQNQDSTDSVHPYSDVKSNSPYYQKNIKKNYRNNDQYRDSNHMQKIDSIEKSDASSINYDNIHTNQFVNEPLMVKSKEYSKLRDKNNTPPANNNLEKNYNYPSLNRSSTNSYKIKYNCNNSDDSFNQTNVQDSNDIITSFNKSNNQNKFENRLNPNSINTTYIVDNNNSNVQIIPRYNQSQSNGVDNHNSRVEKINKNPISSGTNIPIHHTQTSTIIQQPTQNNNSQDTNRNNNSNIALLNDPNNSKPTSQNNFSNHQVDINADKKIKHDSNALINFDNRHVNYINNQYNNNHGYSQYNSIEENNQYNSSYEYNQYTTVNYNYDQQNNITSGTLSSNGFYGSNYESPLNNLPTQQTSHPLSSSSYNNIYQNNNYQNTNSYLNRDIHPNNNMLQHSSLIQPVVSTNQSVIYPDSQNGSAYYPHPPNQALVGINTNYHANQERYLLPKNNSSSKLNSNINNYSNLPYSNFVMHNGANSTIPQNYNHYVNIQDISSQQHSNGLSYNSINSSMNSFQIISTNGVTSGNMNNGSETRKSSDSRKIVNEHKGRTSSPNILAYSHTVNETQKRLKSKNTNQFSWKSFDENQPHNTESRRLPSDNPNYNVKTDDDNAYSKTSVSNYHSETTEKKSYVASKYESKTNFDLNRFKRRLLENNLKKDKQQQFAINLVNMGFDESLAISFLLIQKQNSKIKDEHVVDLLSTFNKFVVDGLSPDSVISVYLFFNGNYPQTIQRLESVNHLKSLGFDERYSIQMLNDQNGNIMKAIDSLVHK